MLHRAAVLSVCLGLAACQPMGSGTVPVSAVQKEAVALCGYLPLAQVVLAIIGKHSANLDSVFAIASSICTAVKPAPASRFALFSAPHRAPTVAGVVIRGKFVK